MYEYDKPFTCIVEEFTDPAFKIKGLVRVVIFTRKAYQSERHISYFFGFSKEADAITFSSHAKETAREKHGVGLSRPNYAPEELPQSARGKEPLEWSVLDLSGTHTIGGKIYSKAMNYFQNIDPTATPCTKVIRAHLIPTKSEI